jgi:hypothetical protein
MKLLHVYTHVFITFFSKSFSSLPPTKKICNDCLDFIADNRECRKFGDTNIITGKISYDSARSVRGDKNKCGEDAILFEKNHFTPLHIENAQSASPRSLITAPEGGVLNVQRCKIITVPYYFLKENADLVLPSGLLGLYFIVITHILHK